MTKTILLVNTPFLSLLSALCSREVLIIYYSARGHTAAMAEAVAGGISAGEELAQLNILNAMLIFNMIVVGGPSWHQAFGASGITGEEPYFDKERKGEVHHRFLAKGAALGKRVA